MKSLKELYRIGKGPSSSHTMGPQRAAKLFLERCPNASYYEVTLYGSLAAIFILMIWTFLTSFIFLAGVEINSVILLKRQGKF